MCGGDINSLTAHALVLYLNLGGWYTQLYMYVYTHTDTRLS